MDHFFFPPKSYTKYLLKFKKFFKYLIPLRVWEVSKVEPHDDFLTYLTLLLIVP